MNDHPTSTSEDMEISVLASYDDLIRNNKVLTAGSEEKFLEYVVSSEISRRRWEHAELECLRLSIELKKSSQDVENLENKLIHARGMLDSEVHLRKKAEAEMDKLASQLHLLRQFVLDTGPELNDVTKDKIKNLDLLGPVSATSGLSPVSHDALLNKRISLANITEASVLDVDELDISFDNDDTADLCESRTRSGASFRVSARRKRSRSGARREAPCLVDPSENPKKRDKRSQSVGFNKNVENLPKKRSNSNKFDNINYTTKNGAKSCNDSADSLKRSFFSTDILEKGLSDAAQNEHLEHKLVKKTVVKPENCVACKRRIKFGKHQWKCDNCKVSIHLECKENVGKCVPLPTEVNSAPFPSLYATPNRNRRMSTILTPSKREPRKIFASPMINAE